VILRFSHAVQRFRTTPLPVVMGPGAEAGTTQWVIHDAPQMKCVGWAKRKRAHHPCSCADMVGTAQVRLCPPYGFDFQTANTVIASVSEAIHRAATEGWIASSLSLLAMTWIQFRDLAAQCVRGLLSTSRPLIKGRRECRALDAPAARRAEKNATPAVVATVTPESPGIPRAMVLRFPSCSPR
jgi:hypothetical protein